MGLISLSKETGAAPKKDGAIHGTRKETKETHIVLGESIALSKDYMPKGERMPLREFANIAELQSCTGQEVAVSDWLEVTQERINAFADATSDHQWIHVDAERCSRESPFGTTIAHGFLTLSLLPKFSYETIRVNEKFRLTLNYGCNKVRFMSPVKCGARIRNRYTLLEVSAVEGGWQSRWQVTVEIEGQQKPACVAETLSRYYSAD